jgi:hypothetical protein
MDDKNFEEVAKVLSEVAGNGAIYQDAIQPVAKQIGKSLETLGGVINVALSPVALMVHGYELIQEKLKEKLEAKLRDVPKDRIVSPPLLIVGPLLEKYRFVHDQNDLAELYENLLASAMDESTVRQTHPAFVHIISQLCPDEAKLLKVIAEDPFVIPKIDVEATFKPDGIGGPWPSSGTLDIFQNFTNLDLKAKLDSTLTRAYITNLERLGILEIRSANPFLNDELYSELVSHPTLKSREERLKDLVNLRIMKGRIMTTDFGHMFIKAAVRGKLNNS